MMVTNTLQLKSAAIFPENLIGEAVLSLSYAEQL